MRVINQLGRFRMLAGYSEEARGVAERALAMSRELGNADQEARALNTLGAARSQAGDMSGIELIEESIAIGRELGTTELLRAMNNLAHQYQWHRGFDAMRPVVAELVATSDRFGYEEWIRWARDKKVTMQYHVGEWAGMRDLLSELIADLTSGRRTTSPDRGNSFEAACSTRLDVSQLPSPTHASDSSWLGRPAIPKRSAHLWPGVSASGARSCSTSCSRCFATQEPCSGLRQ